MKSKFSIAFCLVTIMVLFNACKKEEGPGGKNTIGGTVYFKNGVTGRDDAAPMATISIDYGTDQASTNFDKTILSNSDGTYNFNGLRKGDYFLTASYTDEHGFKYTTKGVLITFNHRKKHAEINFVLE
jgi:hypothetical protein